MSVCQLSGWGLGLELEPAGVSDERLSPFESGLGAAAGPGGGVRVRDVIENTLRRSANYSS
jgi:hypothetical protein